MVLILRKKRLLTACCLLLALGFCAAATRLPSLAAAQAVSAAASTPTVILDAGHGGADGGAVSAGGVAESGLNLAIVQRLRDVLVFCGHRVLLTRTGEDALCDDPSATLRQQKVADTKNRVALINGYPDARLISIHQNTLPGHPSVRGAQSFHNGKGSAEAMAQCIQRSLNAAVNSREKDARRIDSSIYLMAHAACPAVLVECGFLSNAEDTALLQQPEHQLHLAAVIASGFGEYCTKEGLT